MKINHNISALVANGHLSRTNKALDKSLERLSSGYKINHAADDSAGMAISQKMKTQIRGLEQSSRNASDGISVIQTAEGALNEVEAMLQRARELSVQAANGTNTAEDREAIQKEIDQLESEIQRISDDTEFNKKSLLNGELDRQTYSDNVKVNMISMTDVVPSEKYDITVVEEGAAAKLVGAGPISTAASADGEIIINGEVIEVKKDEPMASIEAKLMEVCDRTGIKMSKDGGAFSFTAIEAGSDKYVEIFCQSPLANDLGLSTLTDPNGTGQPAGRAIGKDAEITLGTAFEKKDPVTNAVTKTANWTARGNIVTITDQGGFEMKIELLEGVGANANANITILDAGPMTLQIGANEGQTVGISIPEISPKTLGIENLNTRTQNGAGEAIGLLDEAVEMVSSIRAKLGAYQNRMEHAIANLDTSSLNLTEALSRIEDVNMAEEMATYTQKNVLAQAGVSMLSQANERPQQVLSLLQ